MEPPSLGRIESIKALYINAPVKKVWAVHTDINKWATWQADITEASLGGKLASGAVFRWKSGGMSIESTIETLVDGEEIVWSGRALGTRALHKWYFRKRATAPSSARGDHGRLAGAHFTDRDAEVPRQIDRPVARAVEEEGRSGPITRIDTGLFLIALREIKQRVPRRWAPRMLPPVPSPAAISRC